MNTSTFSSSIDQRYFEDYVPGSVHECGSISVQQSEIVAFARQFDPQSLHVDPEAARTSVFGGLIASGWHTAGLMMRLYVENYLSHIASFGSPGVDELRWLKPVRPGDELFLRVTVMEAVRSRSKPDRGVVRSFIEVRNEADEVVMTMKALNLLGCRNGTYTECP